MRGVEAPNTMALFIGPSLTLASFAHDVVVLAWRSFVSALGTTDHGFFYSAIYVFVLTLLFTHIAIWLDRGFAAMTTHAREHLKISVVVFAAVIIVAYVPLYLWHVFVVVPHTISEQATRIPTKSFRLRVRPPLFAYEVSKSQAFPLKQELASRIEVVKKQ
jgi:hypothetical protein